MEEEIRPEELVERKGQPAEVVVENLGRTAEDQVATHIPAERRKQSVGRRGQFGSADFLPHRQTDSTPPPVQ